MRAPRIRIFLLLVEGTLFDLHLKQAGKIAHDDLVQYLEAEGYTKTMVEGYFRHETRDIDFTLVVDDFLIKYTNDNDLDHLRATISKHYKFKVDLEAKQYVGINLKWNYDKGTVQYDSPWMGTSSKH